MGTRGFGLLGFLADVSRNSLIFLTTLTWVLEGSREFVKHSLKVDFGFSRAGLAGWLAGFVSQ